MNYRCSQNWQEIYYDVEAGYVLLKDFGGFQM